MPTVMAGRKSVVKADAAARIIAQRKAIQQDRAHHDPFAFMRHIGGLWEFHVEVSFASRMLKGIHKALPCLASLMACRAIDNLETSPTRKSVAREAGDIPIN